MEYEKQRGSGPNLVIRPRLIIHGGAGNIVRQNYPAEKYDTYRSALLSIICKARNYMNSIVPPSIEGRDTLKDDKASPCLGGRPSALEVATYAVTLLEDNPLFNSGHGSVFTRDGINQLEASVMVSRGHKKRGVGVMGLRRVRNPILLARKMLEHGDEDLSPPGNRAWNSSDVDVPSAQGHTQIFGLVAEKLAEKYGLELVDPSYFFTQERWEEHLRALKREKEGYNMGTWDADEYLPQGTCGAVALDENGIVCAATSTGGMTNKLTGRVGDTPVVGAGFWAEEWSEAGDLSSPGVLGKLTTAIRSLRGNHSPFVSISGPLRGLLADCFPTPLMYSPLECNLWPQTAVSTRSIAVSGTGNGDSFLRITAARTVAAMMRWRPESGAAALTHVVGPGGELQQSAGERWKRTGEGEGGMIGIEVNIVRDSNDNIIDTRTELLMDYNCGGMFRAWIDDHDEACMSIWCNGSSDK